MYQIMMNDVAPGLNQATQNVVQALNIVAQNLDINWTTGQTNVNNPAAVQAVFDAMFDPEDAQRMGSLFIHMLQDGFAVADIGLGPGTTFGVPWRALFHEQTRASLTNSVWDALGFTVTQTPAEILAGLPSRFPQMPGYMQEPLGVESVWQARRQMLMMRPDGAPGRDPKEPVNEPPDDDPPYRPDPAVVQRVVSLAKEAAECLAGGEWSLEVVRGIFPIGPKVCLDRACADRVEKALWAAVGAEISAILTASFKPAAVLAAAGGWAGLALLHFSFHWAALIALNKTANGVCIVHFFPWFSPMFGGILNGYAIGR